MNTPFAVFGLRFFAISIALGMAVVILAPLPFIRLLGLVALLCAAAGFVLHLHALHSPITRSQRRPTAKALRTAQRTLAQRAVPQEYRPLPQEHRPLPQEQRPLPQQQRPLPQPVPVAGD